MSQSDDSPALQEPRVANPVGGEEHPEGHPALGKE